VRLQLLSLSLSLSTHLFLSAKAGAVDDIGIGVAASPVKIAMDNTTNNNTFFLVKFLIEVKLNKV
jgi:hypothetical protein